MSWRGRSTPATSIGSGPRRVSAAALLEYLLGFVPDAPTDSFELRPHLPTGWPKMAFRGLRVGEDRFDVEVERLERGHAVRVRSMASRPYRVVLRWDAPLGAPLAVVVDGEQVSEDDLAHFEHFEQQSVRTAPELLRAGGTLSFEM
ncbi:MAG: hypothetical protein JRI23_33245 [Deltaproteobacteria bacterium]|jgi:hypothetical protein|nr:hypothetical protein [Deltaproteobacteria bacterium]MBW2537138.1 hypothetical protein [Deltaproteobacteria bacterium]